MNARVILGLLISLLFTAVSYGAGRCFYDLPDNLQTKEVDAPACFVPKKTIGIPYACHVAKKHPHHLVCINAEDNYSATARYFFDCFTEEYQHGKWIEEKKKGIWRCV